MKRVRALVKLTFVVCGVTILVFVLGSVIPRAPTLKVNRETVYQNTKVKVTLDGMITHLNPLYVKDGIIYAMEDHYLYVSKDAGRTFQQRGKLPKTDDGFLTKVKDLIARNRFVRYFRKNRLIGNIAVLPSGTIIVVYDQVYRSDDDGLTFTSVFTYPEEVVPPFMAGLAVTPTGDVYFGEYDAVSRPHPISIIKGEDDGMSWREIYTFPSGQIFHVHSLTYDRYHKGLLIATGDRDRESHLFFTDDDFHSLREVGGESQDWRIVSLIPTQNAIFWGSDNDQKGASIFRWDRKTMKLDAKVFTGTPSYFSTQLKDGTMVISTAHEPRSVFSRSFHPDPRTSLWVSRHGHEWFEILTYDSLATLNRNDAIRASFFLPDGDGSVDALITTPHYTVEHDFMLHRLEIEWLD